MSLTYDISHTRFWREARELVISDSALEVLSRYRQLDTSALEAGGQLFGVFDRRRIVIEIATEPKLSDHATRTSFSPDPASEQKDIFEQFRSGRHYVGDWHTHPEDRPSPSSVDRKNFMQIYRKSKRQISAFTMIILGRAAPPGGLFVATCTAYRFVPCNLL